MRTFHFATGLEGYTSALRALERSRTEGRTLLLTAEERSDGLRLGMEAALESGGPVVLEVLDYGCIALTTVPGFSLGNSIVPLAGEGAIIYGV